HLLRGSNTRKSTGYCRADHCGYHELHEPRSIIMRQILLFLLANFSLGLLTSTTIQAQTASSKASSEVVSSPAREFWKRLTAHCAKAYEGRSADGINQPDFEGKRLVMHVRYCDATTIQIPFFVGDDRSRTWVLTYD